MPPLRHERLVGTIATRWWHSLRNSGRLSAIRLLIDASPRLAFDAGAADGCCFARRAPPRTSD
jgi:hypothetical protein